MTQREESSNPKINIWPRIARINTGFSKPENIKKQRIRTMNRFSKIMIALMVPFVLFAACGRKGPETPPDTTPPQVVATAPKVNKTDVPPSVKR
jgi:predicted small lipoprotein YifL